MKENYESLSECAELLKVLAHPMRLCIVKGLLEKGQCNVSFMQSCLDLPQSTVSQHLQKLKSAKIIEGERNGLEIKYHVCDERVRQIIDVLFKEE